MFTPNNKETTINISTAIVNIVIIQVIEPVALLEVNNGSINIVVAVNKTALAAISMDALFSTASLLFSADSITNLKKSNFCVRFGCFKLFSIFVSPFVAVRNLG